jgi:membrane complex biogenesis BtpA family protein
MIPRLIGMVHLGPLPGAPAFGGDFNEVLDAATADAELIAAAGFDAIMIENFGDAPFFADDVPKVTIAAMARAVAAIGDRTGMPLGVNVLRNDGLGAVAVAAATGASYFRVNVVSGTMYTDQGPIVGRAAEIARLRRQLAPEALLFADVFVKHAVPPPDLTLEQATADLAKRGGADAIVVSGDATGKPPSMPLLRKVHSAAAGTPLLIGSGATTANIARFLSVADGVIAGTAIKESGVTTAPIDPKRAAALVAAAS